MQWYPDGSAIATGSEDGICRVFDLRSSEAAGSGGSDIYLDAMKAHPDIGVKSLAFSNTGQVLFAGYEDGVVVGWDLHKQQPIRENSFFLLSLWIDNIRHHGFMN